VVRPGAMGPRSLAEDPARAARIAEALSCWFRAHARDLPFRRTRDPYAIWVSEVMLQQTRVATVVAYYERFLARFPTVEALAAADEDEVLAAFSGLGYYRRARLLHAGARCVVARYGGALPRDEAALRTIPGIGAYTAGAIASIAFDRPAPAVDGNVARVLARLDGIEDPAEQVAGRPGLAARARALLSAGRPRVLAQATMELGALVCTPQAPACDRCPVAGACHAHRTGRVDRIPAPRRRPARPQARFVAAVLRWRDGVVLERRPAGGLLGGLWCPPLAPCRARVRPRAPARAVADRGLAVEWTGSAAGWVRHAFTHRVWLVAAWSGELRAPPPESGALVVWRPGEAPPGGLPSLARRILAHAGVEAATKDGGTAP